MPESSLASLSPVWPGFVPEASNCDGLYGTGTPWPPAAGRVYMKNPYRNIGLDADDCGTDSCGTVSVLSVQDNQFASLEISLAASR